VERDCWGVKKKREYRGESQKREEEQNLVRGKKKWVDPHPHEKEAEKARNINETTETRKKLGKRAEANGVGSSYRPKYRGRKTER